MTDSDADIVVAGAGHNSLLAACYLAKAGYQCLVLDARPVPGGGAATEELLLPGFGIDTCATGHTMIRVNPALLHDELGLAADYGLRYAEPDPVEQVAFPDGRQLTMWLDRDRTAEEIARFSTADAAAYLRLLDEYDQVKHVFSEIQFTPVGYGPGAGGPAGRAPARPDLGPAAAAVRGSGGPARVHQPAHPGLPALDGVPGVPAGGRAGLRGAALRPDVRPPAAQLVHPDRRVRAADRRAHRLPGRSRRHRAVRPAGDPAAAGRRPVHRGGNGRRHPVPGGHRRAVHHPRAAPARHGTPARLAGGVPLRGGHLRRRGARLRQLLLRHRTAAVPGGRPGPGKPAHRRVGRPGRLAGGDDPDERRPAHRPVHRGPAVGAGGHPHAGRPGPGALRPAHGEDPQPAGLPAGRAGPG